MLDTLGGLVSSIGDMGKALGDFFSAIHDRNTWIRVASVILGVLLLALALWPRR